jgi:hypothetical protein
VEIVESLESLALHDATFLTLEIDWARGTCTIAVKGAIRPGAMGARLQWSQISAVSITREQPWGPSVSILEAKSSGSADEITLQSGDRMRVTGSARHVEIHYQAV